MTADDDELDDASLKSMRAVWLSMRDEEPPAAGMSALLAAAREKAEHMSKPTLWQRVAGLLRRPPALAFATVMILVGGAVLVTRNTQDKVASEVATAPTTENVSAREQAPEKATETAGAPSQPEQSPTLEPPPPPPPPAIAVEPTPNDKPVRRERARAEGQKARAKDDARKPLVDDDKYVKEEVDLGETKAPELGLDGRGATGGTTLDTPGRVEPGTTSPRRPVVTGGDAPATEDTVILSEKTAGKPKTPPVEQLARQATSAASRGDCAAVRVIVERIKKQDANYYKTRVATNVAIAKCL